MPDSEIDTSDIPELPAAAWKNAVRGRFYRPIKQAVSLRRPNQRQLPTS